ncbi:DMT family transporter [Eggerthia catenaformis]|uniref:DMT family transporter n=1 Tax=Eggerthia catenaformis TaxID=31973 RepID=UPI00248F1067|nr:DMT family transporter [Eggerthia catenaformis]
MKSKIKGIVFILTAAFFFALMNVFVKMAGDLPLAQKSFFRNLIAFFFAWIVMIRKKEKPDIRKDNMIPLIARASAGTIGIFCNYYAIDHMVTADANTLNKLSPFFVIIFSYFILKEKIMFKQSICVLLAGIGSLFVVKPSLTIFSHPASIIGMLGGMAAGLAYTLVRVCSKKNTPSSTIVLFFSGFSCLAALPFFILSPASMTLHQLLIMTGAGISGGIGQFAVTSAYSYAPAREISVYDYSQVIFSTVLGIIILSELPDIHSFIGYIIIIGVGILMFVFNKKTDTISA